MIKAYWIIFLSIILLTTSFAQDDRFSQLNSENVKGYATPLVTTLGMGINSGGFHSASVAKTFGFSISLKGMMITVPNDQLTFKPSLPDGYNSDENAPTFWGEKGGNSYLGPNGYVSLPGGIDEQSIPFAMPQVALSFLGTEVMLRFIPTIKAGDEEINFFGVGVKHSVSQYIPLLPLDIAVQGIYNKVKFSDIVEGTNLAFNVHASKSFGIIALYSGLQYESSTFDLNYTIQGDPNSGDPTLRQDKDISAEVDGDNNFRFIVGGALKLAVIVINADINLGSQTVFTTGLSFEF